MSKRTVEELIEAARCWDEPLDKEDLAEIRRIRKRAGLLPSRAQNEVRKVRKAWRRYRRSVRRSGLLVYLEEVYALVSNWWSRGLCRAYVARLARSMEFKRREPFAVVLLATGGQHVDRRVRSKWSRCLRFVAERKLNDRRFDQFIQQNGGINRCAYHFSLLHRKRVQADL